MTALFANVIAVDWKRISLTFGDRKVGDCLPPVHGHPPSTFNTTTAEVDDELVGVTAKCGQHGLQAIECERA